jgi:hypothetical protein
VVPLFDLDWGRQAHSHAKGTSAIALPRTSAPSGSRTRPDLADERPEDIAGAGLAWLDLPDAPGNDFWLLGAAEDRSRQPRRSCSNPAVSPQRANRWLLLSTHRCNRNLEEGLTNDVPEHRRGTRGQELLGTIVASVALDAIGLTAAPTSNTRARQFVQRLQRAQLTAPVREPGFTNRAAGDDLLNVQSLDTAHSIVHAAALNVRHELVQAN